MSQREDKTKLIEMGKFPETSNTAAKLTIFLAPFSFILYSYHVGLDPLNGFPKIPIGP